MVRIAKASKSIPIIGTIPPNFRNDPYADDIIAEDNPMIRSFAAPSTSCWRRSSTA